MSMTTAEARVAARRRTSAQRSRWQSTLDVVVPPAIVVAIILGLWQLSGLFLNPLLLSTPTAIIAALVNLASNGQIWLAFGQSLEELVIGLALGLVIGTTFGVLMGHYPTFDRILSPYVNFFNATPLVVVIPLLVIWVGISTTARLLFVFLISLWPVLLNTAAGVRNTREGYMDVGRAFGFTGWRLLWTISLPAAMPYIFAGIRVSTGLAIIGMILSEMEVSMVGLGFLLMNFGSSFETARLFAVVLVTSTLGVVSVQVLKWIQRQFFPWIHETT